MIKEIGADIIAEIEVLAETIAKYQKSGVINVRARFANIPFIDCLLYTSDAADDLLCVDLGGRRLITKKNNKHKFVTDKYKIETR